MQILLQLQPDRPLCLPFTYQYQLQSAIYAKLAEIDASDFWHDIGFGDTRKFKAFTFGPIKGKYTVKDNKILFENNVSLEVRSPVFAFCDDLQRALELHPQIKLFDTIMTVTNASIVNLHINRPSAVFRTESPILLWPSPQGSPRSYRSARGPRMTNSTLESATILNGNMRRCFDFLPSKFKSGKPDHSKR